MLRKWMLTCALTAAAGLATPAISRAQDDAAEDPNTGALSFVGGADYTTAYFFRGYNQEDSRLIVQPYLTGYVNLAESDSLTLNAYAGTWLSLHEQPSVGDGIIYETDYYAGIDAAFAPFTVGLIYTAYTYPTDAAEEIQEFGLKFSYDDTDLWGGDFALKPYVAVYKETSDENGSNDTYMELGIGPSFAAGDVTIGVPVVVGTSLDDYYLDDDGDDEFLGYISVGVTASMPLPMPARYGDWTLTGGLYGLYLAADNVEDLNEDIGNGDDVVLIGKVGVSFSY